MFDLGGVLIENDTFSRLQTLLPQAMAMPLLKDKWLQSPTVRDFESGKIGSQEFASSFIQEWSLPVDEQGFIAEFVTWPRAYYAGVKDLLATLRQHYKLACLSNCNVLHWEKFAGIRPDFDVAMSSHLPGVTKPDTLIFEKALALCDMRPDEVWFFDDAMANVQAAIKLGIKGFHCDGFNAVRNCLDEYDL
ncbi:MAG: HAD-IA family hydrolase [Burkholderiales bacterium]|nr:HAD-IA family hydrolase [Burkholderiales bacterium]